MNLRKDHYRSFTRTVRTVSLFFLEGVAHAAFSEGTPLRRTHGSRSVCSSYVLFTPWCALEPPTKIENHTTRFDGYLGMSNDEERSEMRYVVRIAEFSESSKL